VLPFTGNWWVRSVHSKEARLRRFSSEIPSVAMLTLSFSAEGSTR